METQTVSIVPPQQTWTARDLEIVPLSKHIGAEVRGVDLANVSDEQCETIHEAWLKHLVLVFRDQDLSDPALISFSARFGELDLAPLDANGRSNAPAHREITVISNVKGRDGKPIGALGAGEAVWHIDMSYNEVPPKGSALYALEVPPAGGETGFLSCYAAFDGLAPELKDRIANLAIKHDATLNSAGIQRSHLDSVKDVRTSPGAWHPAVHVHPGLVARQSTLAGVNMPISMGFQLMNPKDCLMRSGKLGHAMNSAGIIRGARATLFCGIIAVLCTGATRLMEVNVA